MRLYRNQGHGILRHYHISPLIFFEVFDETDEVGMTKPWPESQLSWQELFLVVARRSNAVHYFHGGQLEVTTRIERFFHLHKISLVIDPSRKVCAARSAYIYINGTVRLSVCLSLLSTAAAAYGGFAAGPSSNAPQQGGQRQMRVVSRLQSP